MKELNLKEMTKEQLLDLQQYAGARNKEYMKVLISKVIK